MTTSTEQNNSEISLSDILENSKAFFKTLLNKWKIILLVVIMGTALGYIIALQTKKIYAANLSFVLEEDKGGGGFSATMGLASQLGLDLGGGSGTIFSGMNLIELLKSRSIIEKTLLSPVTVEGENSTFAEKFIDEMKLREHWKDKPKLLNIHFPLNKSRDKFTREENDVLSTIDQIIVNKRLKVELRDKKVNITDVRFTSENEILAKMFTIALVNKVAEFYTETKTKKSAYNIAILEKQLDSIKSEMSNAMSRVASENDNAFNLNPAFGIHKVPAQKKVVDVQVNSAIYTQLIQNLEMSKISMRKETPLIQIIDEPIYPLPIEEASKLMYSLVGLIFSFILISGWLLLQFILKMR